MDTVTVGREGHKVIHRQKGTSGGQPVTYDK